MLDEDVPNDRRDSLIEAAHRTAKKPGDQPIAQTHRDSVKDSLEQTQQQMASTGAVQAPLVYNPTIN